MLECGGQGTLWICWWETCRHAGGDFQVTGRKLGQQSKDAFLPFQGKFPFDCSAVKTQQEKEKEGEEVGEKKEKQIRSYWNPFQE